MAQERQFRDEVLEISEDLRCEAQYVLTFYDDPYLRSGVEQLIDGALGEARSQGRRRGNADGAYQQAALMLLTYGFYLGREHARRGYSSPMSALDDDGGLFPDTPAGLGG